MMHAAQRRRLLRCLLLGVCPLCFCWRRVDWHKAGNQRLRCLRITAKEERAVRQKLQVRHAGRKEETGGLWEANAGHVMLGARFHTDLPAAASTPGGCRLAAPPPRHAALPLTQMRRPYRLLYRPLYCLQARYQEVEVKKDGMKFLNKPMKAAALRLQALTGDYERRQAELVAQVGCCGCTACLCTAGCTACLQCTACLLPGLLDVREAELVGGWVAG